MDHTFFATMSRMKYIQRWALMRNSRTETLSEHALEVAVIAHALCTLANVRHGRRLNAERAALIGMYHDASEIITGDMPTPVKYYNADIRDAYKAVEAAAEDRLLQRLPEDLRPVYGDIFGCRTESRSDEEREAERYMRRLVKAADKLSALIKCIEEARSGNTEFVTARESTEAALDRLEKELPEVEEFRREFLPSYGKTLDELG